MYKKPHLKLLLVGGKGGSNVATSLLRSARELGALAYLWPSNSSMGQGTLQAIAWHVWDRRPIKLTEVSSRITRFARRNSITHVLCTGAAPINASDVIRLNGRQVETINFSTDDPFSPAHRSKWHLQALRSYKKVFTPRTANLAELQAHCDGLVRFLPFGWDPTLVTDLDDGSRKRASSQFEPDLLFIGGADKHRARTIAYLRKALPRLRIVLAGSYWERFDSTRDISQGQVSPSECNALTRRAKISLSMNRRHNRDGHVMRTLEIAALGGLILAEDTVETRDILGIVGSTNLLFDGSEQLVSQINSILKMTEEDRASLRSHLHSRLSLGGHTYSDRLKAMIDLK